MTGPAKRTTCPRTMNDLNLRNCARRPSCPRDSCRRRRIRRPCATCRRSLPGHWQPRQTQRSNPLISVQTLCAMAPCRTSASTCSSLTKCTATCLAFRVTGRTSRIWGHNYTTPRYFVHSLRPRTDYLPLPIIHIPLFTNNLHRFGSFATVCHGYDLYDHGILRNTHAPCSAISYNYSDHKGDIYKHESSAKSGQTRLVSAITQGFYTRAAYGNLTPFSLIMRV